MAEERGEKRESGDETYYGEFEEAFERQMGGGGGGSLGGTMESRLEEALPGLDAAQAADTGGMIVDPTRGIPEGLVSADWDADVGGAEEVLRADPSVPDAEG